MTNKKLNVILGNAPVLNINRGCVALSYTSIYLIDRVLSEAGINYKLYLPDSGLVQPGEYKMDIAGKLVSFESIYHIKSNGTKENFKSLIKRLINYKNFSDFMHLYKNADFILDTGLGDSFADLYGKERFNSINLIHQEAIAYHKPYCLLPQTIGPFNNDVIRSKAIKVLENASMVMTRDKQSYDYTKKIAKKQKKVKEYIDMAFFLPYTRQYFDKNYIHVGLSISAMLWQGGYTHHNEFGLEDDYKLLIRSIISFFLQMSNVKLHLTPHVVHGERFSENDYALSFDLLKEFNNPNLILSPLFLSPVDAKDYISGMDFFMGARMHATIAAFSSGVPVVPMAYSRKFNGLFISTLNYNHLVDLKTDTNDIALSKIKDAFENRVSLKEEIKHQNDTVVEERKKMLIEDLKDFFHL